MTLTMAEPADHKLLNISEAARRLGIHDNTLRQWADRGKVKHVRLMSGVRRFDPDEIERVRREMGYEGG
jgi:excisionase family DNA binding protein